MRPTLNRNRLHDLILVGGGLANGLLAWYLQSTRPELDVLVLERQPQLGGVHTWSFHDSDLTDTQRRWLQPLISNHWDGYAVKFPEFERAFEGGYSSIDSARFAQVLQDALGKQLRLGAEVISLTPDTVQLACGETLHARAVLDGRGALESPHMALGYQAFVGQRVVLAQPHGLHRPLLMDASVAQGEGYRFVYVLPLDSHRLLIEDTHYVDQPILAVAPLREHINAYAQAQGWQVMAVEQEEQGALPIILAGDAPAFWSDAHRQPLSGLRAGLFHATTGYSLPHAVRLAELIGGLPDISAAPLYSAIAAHARRDWRRQGFFRLLNRMLFLAGRPNQRWRVMQRFYRLPAGLIQRFYAGQLKVIDRLRIVIGKPPVPLLQALRAAFKSQPKAFRKP